MLLPSFDQPMGETGGPGGRLDGNDHVPLVRRFASPPVAGTSHRCVGRTVSEIVKSSLPTRKVVRNLSSPLSSGLGSATAYAMLTPSGLHANCETPSLPLVTCSASPPFIGSTKSCPFLSASCAMNPMRSPEGDQRGELAWWRSRVSGRVCPLDTS